MFKVIKDENNNIIQFIPTTHEAVEIETRAEKPKDEIGFDWVEKVKGNTTEWEKIERELTEQEKILKELNETKEQANATAGAVQELTIGMLGGGM